MKFAVLFYGLTRSLKWTERSIRRNLLGELPGSVLVFLHTFSLKEIHNPRAAEYHLTPDNEDYKRLQADRVKVENQDEVDKILPLETIRAYGQPWPKQKTWITLDNVSRQFYSLAAVWQLFETYLSETGTTVDYVVVARPDVEFLKPFTVSDLRHIDDSHYLVPRFHWYHGGINDRFLVATPGVAAVYCNRREFVDEFCKETSGPLHPEQFVEWVMRNKAGASPIKGHMVFHRIRADGRPEVRDQGLRDSVELPRGPV